MKESRFIGLGYGQLVIENLGDDAVRFTDFGIYEEYRGEGLAKATVKNIQKVWSKVYCETVFNETMEHILKESGFNIIKEEKGVKYWCYESNKKY